MDTLWESSKVAKVVKGTISNNFPIYGISIDTRSLKKGDMFIAIKGINNNGHDYIDDAFKKGASCVLASEKRSNRKDCILVKDTFKSLWDLAVESRKRSKAKIIGVTGSVGKTGTKEALKFVLGSGKVTYASDRSYNNHYGVPLSLINMPQSTEVGIFEMGMNHKGEILKLVNLVEPNISLITNVAKVHSAFFDSLEKIVEAKGEIFHKTAVNNTAILNRDNQSYKQLREIANKNGISSFVTFGIHNSSNVRLVSHKLKENGSFVRAKIDNKIVEYEIKIPGYHWVINSLAVHATCLALEENHQNISARISKLQPLDGRGRFYDIAVRNGYIRLVDESYNASPPSMEAAIETFSLQEKEKNSRRVAFLGDMLELGDNSKEMHIKIKKSICKSKFDLIFTIGKNMKYLYDSLPKDIRGQHFNRIDSFPLLSLNFLKPGDKVLVKGSNAMKMKIIVNEIKKLKNLKKSKLPIRGS